MTLEEKKRNRYKFLRLLYETVEGNTLQIENMFELGRKIELDRETTSDIVDFLVKEGLIKYKALGGAIGITHRGVVEVERTF